MRFFDKNKFKEKLTKQNIELEISKYKLGGARDKLSIALRKNLNNLIKMNNKIKREYPKLFKK